MCTLAVNGSVGKGVSEGKWISDGAVLDEEVAEEVTEEGRGNGDGDTMEASVLGSVLLVTCSGDRAFLLVGGEDKDTKSSCVKTPPKDPTLYTPPCFPY